MSVSIEIRHNFEAGHRLPHLPGKCQSLHGHSFWATVTLEAQGRLYEGIAVEYGDAKAWLRGWIDEHWDHGLILGREDALYDILAVNGKVYSIPDGWPTVETLALTLAAEVDSWCRDLNRDPVRRGDRPAVRPTVVKIQETHVNAATWTASPALWGA